MNTWWWLMVGVGLLLALSVVVALAVAAVLGQIGREVSDLLENHHWASAPLARDMGDDAQQEASSRRSRRAAAGSPLR